MARCLRDYGQSEKYVHSQAGLNSRLDELHAAVLHSAILPRLVEFTTRRRQIARRYLAEINHPQLEIVPRPEGSHSVYHLFPLLVNGSRTSFLAHLKSQQIAGGIHYPILIPDQPALAGASLEVRTPLHAARRFADAEVSLPIHPFLAEDQISAVVAACNTWTP